MGLWREAGRKWKGEKQDIAANGKFKGKNKGNWVNWRRTLQRQRNKVNFVGTLKFHITELWWDLDETSLLISISLSAHNEMVLRLRGDHLGLAGSFWLFRVDTSSAITLLPENSLGCFPRKNMKTLYLCEWLFYVGGASWELKQKFTDMKFFIFDTYGTTVQQYLCHWLGCTPLTNLLGTSCHREARTWGLTLEAWAGEKWVIRKHRGKKTKQVVASQIGEVFMLKCAVGVRG